MSDVTQWGDFVAWWVEVEANLLRVARRYNVSTETARDIVQDLAVLAIRNLDHFANELHFRHWVYSRLHWLMLDELRKQKHQFQPLEDTKERSVPPDQERKLIMHEILGFISELPKQQQAALRGMLEGHSTKAIAKEIKVSEATVRSLQRYARKSLINLLTEREVMI
jgi:RNA polymerase sigma factor (sigma-70 family)